MKISIHSTTRVETSRYRKPSAFFGISIHSTTRVETKIDCFLFCPKCISIHSTTRVETIEALANCDGDIDFNPLHHEGGDLYFFSEIRRFVDFNPLHHEGGDQLYPADLMESINFNPLHHEGGDFIVLFLVASLSFQSTPPRGWRPYTGESQQLPKGFQSTPPRGWRPDLHLALIIGDNFNPLHHEGGDYQRAGFRTLYG